MGRAGLGVGLAIAALLFGGCGSAVSGDAPGASGASGGSNVSGPAGSSSTPSPSTPTRARVGGGGADVASSYGPAFPLTLRRTGGIAGFDDRIVLGLDGRMHVDTRSVHGRVCTLGAQQQRQLLSLLATLRLDPSGDPSPSGEASGEATGTVDLADSDPVSDPITISVTDDAARLIDLSDPSLGEVAGLVGNLVDDVTLSVPASTRCTTGPATTPPAAPAR